MTDSRLLRILAIAIAVTGAASLLIFFALFKTYRIPTGAMLDTLPIGSRVIARRYSFAVPVLPGALGVRDIQRGDLAVFKFPLDPNVDYVKRVIAMPGETIEVVDKRVKINGRFIEEPYARNDDELTPGDHMPPFRVPPGHYFVLGDNRSRSYDSRYWGPVPRDKFGSKIVLTYWKPLFKDDDESIVISGN